MAFSTIEQDCYWASDAAYVPVLNAKVGAFTPPPGYAVIGYTVDDQMGMRAVVFKKRATM